MTNGNHDPIVAAGAACAELEFKGPGGLGARVKGYRLMDLAFPVIAVALVYLGILVTNHNADAKDDAKTTAQVLEKSNAVVAKTTKEAGDQNAAAIREMAAEQKRGNQAMRELICVMTLPQDRRMSAADVCKRIARDGR